MERENIRNGVLRNKNDEGRRAVQKETSRKKMPKNAVVERCPPW